ncbi:C2H2-type zinc finger protein [Methanolobus bombayensis]|uniref:C2H2-type zinc finger protein n=1 Tax=Methanolobus bombayensis TaxID=38023 RepID=UPI001AE3E442|nr:C2H2-type zinc finger protein [Methanolobus bombayensis]MBP1908303.1 hypothetical protein [Methanolobus bombayensis]
MAKPRKYRNYNKLLDDNGNIRVTCNESSFKTPETHKTNHYKKSIKKHMHAGPALPTLHAENEGRYIVYSPKKTTSPCLPNDASSFKDKYFTCSCGAKFITKDMFKLHVRTYKHYSCYYCGNDYDTYNGLIFHLTECTKCLTRNEKFQCDYCGRKFRTKGDLNLHIKSTHKNEHENLE